MPLSEENNFPSLHARCYMHHGQRCSIYEIGCLLSATELKNIIYELNKQGFPIVRLEFYEYAPADAMRHLFVWMQGSTESVPYFQLDADCWRAIVKLIVGN